MVSGGTGDTRAAKLAPSPRKGWRDMSAPSAILKVLVLRLGLSHQTTICPVSVYKLKQAYSLISRRPDILRFDIKRQDLGPRQPADSGKVVAANAGCGWLKQRNEFDTATT